MKYESHVVLKWYDVVPCSGALTENKGLSYVGVGCKMIPGRGDFTMATIGYIYLRYKYGLNENILMLSEFSIQLLFSHQITSTTSCTWMSSKRSKKEKVIEIKLYMNYML